MPARFAVLVLLGVAILAGDAAALKTRYDPSVQIQDPKKQPISLADELQFWAARKNGLQAVKLDVLHTQCFRNRCNGLRLGRSPQDAKNVLSARNAVRVSAQRTSTWIGKIAALV